MQASDGTDIETLIEDIEKRSEKLNEWELKFMDDLGMQLRRGRVLSPKQIEKIEQIWEKVT